MKRTVGDIIVNVEGRTKVGDILRVLATGEYAKIVGYEKDGSPRVVRVHPHPSSTDSPVTRR